MFKRKLIGNGSAYSCALKHLEKQMCFAFTWRSPQAPHMQTERGKCLCRHCDTLFSKSCVSAKACGQEFLCVVEWSRKHKEILWGSGKGLFSGLYGSSCGREVNKFADNFQTCDVHLINWSRLLGVRPGCVYGTYILDEKCRQGPLLLWNLVPVNNSEPSIKRAFSEYSCCFLEKRHTMKMLWNYILFIHSNVK